MSGTGLKQHRGVLMPYLALDPAGFQGEWQTIKPLIENWWRARKLWEAQDTFNEAYRDGRMTVRTFTKDFSKEVSKRIAPGTLRIPDEKFYSDSQRTSLAPQHATAFHEASENQKYWQNRGIDSSAFTNPANFISREQKYREGLHDLSASLLDPADEKSIDEQLFNHDDGAHCCFLPLSKEEDQQVLWKLTGIAKALMGALPELYTLVRNYRAKMTRIKLARDYDIGTGFIVTPTANTGAGPHFKMQYGLGTTMKKKLAEGGGIRKLSLERQREVRDQLRQQALRFKQILRTTTGTNEIVIAMRRHLGPFPVYAELDKAASQLLCFDISGATKVPNGKTISLKGVMT